MTTFTSPNNSTTAAGESYASHSSKWIYATAHDVLTQLACCVQLWDILEILFFPRRRIEKYAIIIMRQIHYDMRGQSAIKPKGGRKTLHITLKRQEQCRQICYYQKETRIRPIEIAILRSGSRKIPNRS